MLLVSGDASFTEANVDHAIRGTKDTPPVVLGSFMVTNGEPLSISVDTEMDTPEAQPDHPPPHEMRGSGNDRPPRLPPCALGPCAARAPRNETNHGR
jgi:hypothetical protein